MESSIAICLQNRPIKTAGDPLKGGREPEKQHLPTTPTTSLLTMSTEREITEKFKEAFDSKNVEILLPHLADDMTYELLPST